MSFHCHVTNEELKPDDAYQGYAIRKEIFSLIQKDYPDFDLNSFISIKKLNYYRKKYLTNLITQEIGELNTIENDVINAISNHKILSENIEEDIDKELTLGQKIADLIARFGGSWGFILFFFFFIIIWTLINTLLVFIKHFDPYPFILLNLLLSCLAAIQAPIIMMSQNRLEEKDRRRGEHDYKVNLKAELEIRLLGEKIDHLMTEQYKKLLEIEQLQMDYLEDILKKLERD